MILQFLAFPNDGEDFITSLGSDVIKAERIDHSPNLAKFTLTLNRNTSTDDILVYDLGNLEALRLDTTKTKKYRGQAVAKHTTYKNGSRFRFIRESEPQKHGFTELTAELTKLDHNRLGKRYNEFQFTIEARTEGAFVECLALAANSDDLAALIKSSALSEVDSAVIIAFCQAKAIDRDRIVSLAVTRIPKWDIRRKARNIRRRLLRAILYREAGLSLQSTKGAKYNLLVNLAKNKNLI